jgi:hypothetical protein
MTRADLQRPRHVDVWSVNHLAVKVFEAMSTQWRVGSGGAIGFDYTALPFVLRMCGVKLHEREDVFSCLRVMELEALSVMHEG